VVPESPFAPSRELDKKEVWVEPKLVVEVAFAKWTSSGWSGTQHTGASLGQACCVGSARERCIAASTEVHAPAACGAADQGHERGQDHRQGVRCDERVPCGLLCGRWRRHAAASDRSAYVAGSSPSIGTHDISQLFPSKRPPFLGYLAMHILIKPRTF
jgi:hypothetical protein